MVYRSDIEGLRAFAVVAIVLFHAGYGIYPAGFIGVDIFFVISGFLIASGIRQSIEAGQFKLLAFYKRRLWRIQPLLFSLMIVAAFFEYHYAGAGDLNAFADSLKSLSLFESNQYFGSLDFGYFADDTSIMPLLHTWSLSMEWKWYFFLPLLLLLFVNNIGKRLLPWLLLVSFVLLAFLSVSGDHSDNTRYYAFWQRCFALMAGTFLATINIRVLAERIPSALHSVLSAMALVSLVYIGATARATAGYPNLYTLWVVLATAILMILGARIEPTGYARQNRLLASKPFTLLGKLSYSLYIWHWPIFVFARYTQVEVTRWETVGLVLLSLVAAILSYVLIENPLRKCHKKATFMATLILLVILPIAFAHRFEGKSERDLPAGFAEDIAKFQGCITPQEITDELRARCKFGDMSKEPTVLLMGDSWSGRFAIFVDHMLADAGLAGFTLTSGHNLPFVNTEQLGLNRMVKANNDQHFRDIAAGKYRYVVVANSMPRYFAVHRSGSQDIRLLSRGRYRSYEAAFRESFDNTLAFIIDNGAVPVFITGLYDRISQIYSPTWGNINYSRCNEFGEECSYEDTSDPYSLEMKAIMAAMQTKYPQMVIIDIHSLLCQDGKCSASIDGLPLYSDIGGHITPYASKRLSEMYLAEHENPFIRGHSF